MPRAWFEQATPPFQLLGKAGPKPAIQKELQRCALPS